LSALRTLCQHETGSAKDRSIAVVLLLRLLTCLALVVVFLEFCDCACLLRHEVDHEWHGKVCQAVAPCNFHYDVKADEVVTCVEHSNVAFAAADINELKRVSKWP
jgi:hypothetical protein